MTVVIAIANEKGGVGKSTSAVNLAAGLALRLRHDRETPGRVLLVDLDPQMNALMGVAYESHTAEAADSLAQLLLSDVPLSPQRFVRSAAHHPNLSFIPSNNAAQKEAGYRVRTLPAPDLRLVNALEPLLPAYEYVVIDTPPHAGSMLGNAIMAADYILIPIEMSYQGATGLGPLHSTIAAILQAYRRTRAVQVGYLPTMFEESARDAVEVLESLRRRYGKRVFEPIHRARAIQQANGAHLDIFLFRPPRSWSDGQLASSTRATREYGALVTEMVKRTDRAARAAPQSEGTHA
jgi:chromosome partitioning protein